MIYRNPRVVYKNLNFELDKKNTLLINYIIIDVICLKTQNNTI